MLHNNVRVEGFEIDIKLRTGSGGCFWAAASVFAWFSSVGRQSSGGVEGQTRLLLSLL